MRVVGRVEIDRPASQAWAYVADYGNDTNWRAGVTHMRPSAPGPAQVGVTTHELLRLLGMSFRTEATIDLVQAGRRLQWRAADRQKRLHGSRLVEPTGPGTCRFTEVVEGRLLGLLRPLEPLVAWLLQRRAPAAQPRRGRRPSHQRWRCQRIGSGSSSRRGRQPCSMSHLYWHSLW